MAIRAAIISGRNLTLRASSSSSLGARSLSSSWWRNVEPAPKDSILGVTEAFLADRSPDKVNVGVGAYRDNEGKPVILECVREAGRRIAGSVPNNPKEYQTLLVFISNNPKEYN